MNSTQSECEPSKAESTYDRVVVAIVHIFKIGTQQAPRWHALLAHIHFECIHFGPHTQYHDRSTSFFILGIVDLCRKTKPIYAFNTTP